MELVANFFALSDNYLCAWKTQHSKESTFQLISKSEIFEVQLYNDYKRSDSIAPRKHT